MMVYRIDPIPIAASTWYSLVHRSPRLESKMMGTSASL